MTHTEHTTTVDVDVVARGKISNVKVSNKDVAIRVDFYASAVEFVASIVPLVELPALIFLNHVLASDPHKATCVMLDFESIQKRSATNRPVVIRRPRPYFFPPRY